MRKTEPMPHDSTEVISYRELVTKVVVRAEKQSSSRKPTPPWSWGVETQGKSCVTRTQCHSCITPTTTEVTAAETGRNTLASPFIFPPSFPPTQTNSSQLYRRLAWSLQIAPWCRAEEGQRINLTDRWLAQSQETMLNGPMPKDSRPQDCQCFFF